MLEEGFDVNKPPMFKGVKYDYWKEMMIAFFESTHIDMSDVVEKGNHIPLDATKKEIPKDKWEDDQKFIFLLKVEMPCCVPYQKKNIPRFTTSEVLNI